MSYQDVFSLVEIQEIGIKFAETNKADAIKCPGTLEETMSVKTVVRKCRGVVTKSRTKGTGEGKVKVSSHMPWDTYCKLFGMDLEGYVEGVVTYGQNSVHPECCLTAKVLDEDGVEMYIAYPKAKIESDLTAKVDGGQTEVAEVEVEFTIYPDDDGNGVYKLIVSDEVKEDVIKDWMSNFTVEMLKMPIA